jgi:hypothetical protein
VYIAHIYICQTRAFAPRGFGRQRTVIEGLLMEIEKRSTLLQSNRR